MTRDSSLFTQHIDGKPSARQAPQRIATEVAQLHEDVMQETAESLFLRGIDDTTWQSLTRHAHQLRKRHRRIVVFGAGAALSCGRIYSSIVYPQSQGMSGHKDGVDFQLCDSLDPRVLSAACGQGETPPCCVFISRSGGTLETREQLRFCLHHYGGNKDEVRCPIVMVLGRGDSMLRRWAQAHDVTIIDFDESLSGRFSPLGVVGIMVGLLAGADMTQVRGLLASNGRKDRTTSGRVLLGMMVGRSGGVL